MTKLEFLKSKGYDIDIDNYSSEELTYYCDKEYSKDWIYFHIEWHKDLGWSRTFQTTHDFFYDKKSLIDYQKACVEAIDILEKEFNEMMKYEEE